MSVTQSSFGNSDFFCHFTASLSPNY